VGKDQVCKAAVVSTAVRSKTIAGQSLGYSQGWGLTDGVNSRVVRLAAGSPGGSILRRYGSRPARAEQWISKAQVG
jgi:hypothetical protein